MQHFVLVLAALLFLISCDTHCISERDMLWEAGPAEYRLELTNLSPFMVELFVNGESVGVFCDGVEKLGVGNFLRDSCSLIEARFLDNPDSIYLDDCSGDPAALCELNNEDGHICYDTTLIDKVEARLD